MWERHELFLCAAQRLLSDCGGRRERPFWPLEGGALGLLVQNSGLLPPLSCTQRLHRNIEKQVVDLRNSTNRLHFLTIPE